jgi:hypothetical protein
MREPSFLKVRRKLKFWTNQDFINLAVHLFGSEDLSLEQMLELVRELKKPGITPPGGLVARDPVIVMKSNTGKYTNTGRSRVYYSKNAVGIQFADIQTAMGWAYRLMVKSGMPWEKALHKVKKENLNLKYFHSIWKDNLNISGLCGLLPGTYDFDHQLLQKLNFLSKYWERMTTPYPDNTPIKRVYHSLGKGDLLVDPEGNLWEVVQTKAHLNGPQEIMLEPVEDKQNG